MNPRARIFIVRRTAPAPARRAVRGAMAVLGALWLGVAAICLMAIDIGHVFWQQREVQRIADMAALARAGGADRCGAAAPSQVERLNGVRDGDRLVAECGNWNPAVDRSAASPPEHFGPVTAADPFNAARVTIERDVPYFFVFSWDTGERTVRASATAATRNMAGFSLGTGLAGLNEGVVNKLLNALLGKGNSIGLSLVDYQGLANAHVNLLELARLATSAGTVEALIDPETSLGVGGLLALTANALGPGNAAAVTALDKLVAVGLDNITLTAGQLLNITTTNPEAAGTAQVNVLELLMVAAQVANGNHAVSLAGGLNLGALAGVATELSVIEPPVIAIGEAGLAADGVTWKTRADSAQVRLKLNASVGAVGGGIQLLRLPLYIDVAPGSAWLSDIQCTATREASSVTIGSQPGLLNVCVGEASMTASSLHCNAPAEVSRVGISIPIIGGLNVYEVRAQSQVSVAPPGATNLNFDGVIGNGDDIQRTDSNAGVLTGTVDSLVRGLDLEACLLGICSGSLSFLTGVLNGLVSNLLTPLLSGLDSLIQPLLGLLGVQVGYSDIHHQSLSCGEPQLVY